MIGKLAPCPFCGKDPQITHNGYGHVVKCVNAECNPLDWHLTPARAAKAWNAQYSAALESVVLEQNYALGKDCLQQMREVRKLRRKLAKLHYTSKHPLGFDWWNRSTIANGQFHSALRSAAFAGALEHRRQREGDGMRKFQEWQDLYNAWPSEATALLAPSRKPDVNAIAQAARKEGATIEVAIRDGVAVLKVKVLKC